MFFILDLALLAIADTFSLQASYSPQMPTVLGIALAIPSWAWVNALIGLLQHALWGFGWETVADGNYICKLKILVSIKAGPRRSVKIETFSKIFDFYMI